MMCFHVRPNCATIIQNNGKMVSKGNVFLFLSTLLDPVLEGCQWIAVIYLFCVYVALWVMVLSRFSAPLITLAPTPPPSCLFIPMTYSFKCNSDNFDKVTCKLQRNESEHKADRERQRKCHNIGARRMKKGSDAIDLTLLNDCWLCFLDFLFNLDVSRCTYIIWDIFILSQTFLSIPIHYIVVLQT